MTRTTISVDLSTTPVHSKCNRLGAATTRCSASLRFDAYLIEFIGTPDQIDDALEQLQIDLACLRAQQEQEEARRSVA